MDIWKSLDLDTGYLLRLLMAEDSWGVQPL